MEPTPEMELTPYDADVEEDMLSEASGEASPATKRARKMEQELRRYQKPDERSVPRREWARRDIEVAELKRLYPRLPEFYLMLAWNMHYRMNEKELDELLEQCDEEERKGCLRVTHAALT